MKSKLMSLGIVLSMAFAHGAGAYVLVDGASIDRDRWSPAAERSELEMKDLSFARMKQEFASAGVASVAQLKVDRDWFCYEAEIYRSGAYGDYGSPKGPNYYQGASGPHLKSVRISAGASGSWPSFLACYGSQYGQSIDYSARPLRAGGVAPGAELTFSASHSGSGTYGNEWYIVSSAAVRAVPGHGIRIHYSGNYTESFRGQTLKDHAVEGYLSCPWTVRR